VKRDPPDHLRARAAHKAIRALGSEPARRYKPYVNALPAVVLGAGLGQAVATYMAAAARSGGDPKSYERILQHLQGWLCDEGGCEWSPYRKPVKNETDRAGVRLLLRITEGSRADLLAGTAEALAYIAWLKKLANALLEDEPARAADREGGTKPDEQAR
jgi:CRISPR type III-B/RAMP module-associated protein Cmr5